ALAGRDAVVAGRPQDDLLALVRAAVRAAGGVGVGQVGRDDVHPHALGGHPRGGDVERAEEAAAHQRAPVISVDRLCSFLGRIAIIVSKRIWFSARFAFVRSTSTPLPSARMACVSTVERGVTCATWDGSLVDSRAEASWSWNVTSCGLKPGTFTLARLFESTT